MKNIDKALIVKCIELHESEYEQYVRKAMNNNSISVNISWDNDERYWYTDKKYDIFDKRHRIEKQDIVAALSLYWDINVVEIYADECYILIKFEESI